MPDSLLDFLSPDKQRNLSVPELVRGIRTFVRETRQVGLIHPHGFCVLPLHLDDSAEWRLHVWPKGPRVISGMPAYVHTHDVVIESRILTGSLTNIVFDVSETLTGGLPLYEVRYQGDKYSGDTQNILCNTNKRVVAKTVSESLLRFGDYYTIEAHEFHQAVVDEGSLTATFVRMHGRSPGAVRVVGLDGFPDKISFKRQPCSGVEIMEMLPV